MKLNYLVLLAGSFFVILLSNTSSFGQCLSAIPYPLTDPCVQQVIAADPFCCTNSWDALCQNAYDDCDPGGGGPASAIVVSTDTYTIPELVTDVWLGSCVDAENISFSGAPAAFGSFTNGNLIGFESGIILSTGNAADAPGPDDGGIVTTSHNTPGDPDLTALSGVATNDAAIIEFDFVSPNDFVSFEYVFASEEYEGFTCSDFVDSFGFFISGPGFAPNTNVALVPGTNTPVAINSVNQGFPSGFFADEGPCTDMDENYTDYSIYFNNSLNGPEIAYNGHTDVFTVELELVPCETYSIKIAIADGTDTSYDSAVFLKEGSFTSGLDVDVFAGSASATADALEGCEDGYFMFVNQGPEITEPTDFNFEISGTATMGDDYTPINDFVTFQPGQDTVFVFIEALLDGIDEGAETIVLSFPEACSCEDTPQVTLNILDNDILETNISEDQTICIGGSATLTVEAEGSLSEPYTYTWSNGANTPEITVNPTETTTYSVTVADACEGQTEVLEVTVIVANEIEVTESAVICDGDSYDLPDGTTANAPGEYIFEYVTAQGCDSIVTIELELLSIPDTFEEIWICEGDSYELPDGTLVTDEGAYDVTLSSIDGCDSLVVTTVNVWENTTTEIDVAICNGDFYELPDGTEVSDAGSYSINLQSVNGCDSTLVFNLQLNPTYNIEVNESLCGSDSFVLPDGTLADESGEYEVILTTVNGCDSVIHVNLQFQGLVVIELEPTLCTPSVYTLPDGTTTSQSGTFDITVGNGECDTLYLIDLTIHPSYTTTIHESICEGDTYVLPNGTPVNSSGSYSINNTTVNGCDSSTVYQISFFPKPIARYAATPPFSSTYDGPVLFTNESINSDSIKWDFGNFGTYTTNDPIIDFNGEAGTYPFCLEIWSNNGCYDQVCSTYLVNYEFKVFIPNAFSPNEDGINDLFGVEGSDIDPDNFHLQIFNRQGELVFESRDPNEKWDGGPAGSEYYTQNEVYVYRVEVHSLSSTEIFETTGHINVIR